MAAAIGADSLHYLPVDAIARSVGIDSPALCQACIDTQYPTPAGRELFQLALGNAQAESNGNGQHGRTYDVPLVSTPP
jgi:amidophosphoribosyltransferase